MINTRRIDHLLEPVGGFFILGYYGISVVGTEPIDMVNRFIHIIYELNRSYKVEIFDKSVLIYFFNIYYVVYFLCSP